MSATSNVLHPPLEKPQRIVTRSIFGLFWPAALALALTTAVLQWGVTRLNGERAAIARTEVIERTLRDLGEDLLDAEAGQRSFLLTGDPRYLEFYRAGTDRVAGHEASLQALMTDHDALSALARLHAVMQTKLGELAEATRLAQTGNRAAAVAVVNGDVGTHLMERFRSLRAEILGIEARLLEDRRGRVKETINAIAAISLLGAALVICLLFLLARRTAERLERALANLESALLAATASGAAARVAQTRVQSLYESTPTMLHSIDRAGHLITVSDHWLKVMGFTRKEVIGTSVTQFLTPASRAYATAEVLPAFFRDGECHDIEYQMVRNDGQILDVLLSAVLQRATAEHAERSVTVITDITERKRLKRALLAQAAQIEDLYDHAPCGYHSVDVDGRYLRVNATEQAWLGHTSDELVGVRSPVDFCAGPDGERLKAAFLRARQTLRPESVEVMLLGRGQAPREVNVLISIVADADGAFQMSRSAMFDISASKRAGLALQRLQREQQAILDSDLIGSLRVRDRRVVWVSSGFERMLGFESGELQDVPTRIFYPDDEHYRAAGEGMVRAVERGDTYRGEMLLRGKQGQTVWVSVSGQRFEPVPDESVWVAMDITARKAAELALQASQTFLAQTGAVAGVGGWSLDLPAGTVAWSDETYRLHELPLGSEVSLAEGLAFYAVEAQPVITAAVQACAADGTPFDLELPLVSAKGRPFWARVVGAREHSDGAAARLIGALQDITERRTMDRALADSHELLRVTLDSIGDAVITTDPAGAIEWLNPVAERMTGWRKDEARGRDLPQVFQILHEQTREPAINPVMACLAQGKIVGLASHTVLIARDGSEYAIEDSASPIRDAQGRVLGVVLVFHDVTEQRRLGHEMRYQVTHDALTDLVNRAEFEARLQRALKSVQDGNSTHTLMFVDLDQFKLVNDACGHAVGDQLLRQVGAMLQHAVRSHDTVARLGGDEFGLLLEHCDAVHAEQIGRKICDHMDEFRFLHDGRRFRIGTSIGLVQIDRCWDNVDTLMHVADTACYAAKEAGRNRVHTWFDTDGQALARRSQVDWATRLERAIDEGLFALFGQRIASLRGRDDGLHCEVLLRLADDPDAVITPSLFLPAAERFHLMPRVDRWVVRHVVRLLNDAAFLNQPFDLIAVNLSGQSIGDRSFHRDVLTMLAEVRFDLRKLCFEITETATITNLADARVFFQEVRALGVRIALDDFGAGASSFSYLKNLPIDILKIDGQFITDLLQDPLDSAAVRCFRDVAQVIGVQTVAEFVGAEDIRQHLMGMGIDYAQGYLIHVPEPFLDLLGKRQTVPARGPG